MTDLPSELIPIPEAARRLGVSVAVTYQGIANRDDSVPGGRVIGGELVDGQWRGGRYIIIRAVFERCLVDGIEPTPATHRNPLIRRIDPARKRAS